jgi:hypothetical protein
MPAFLLLFRGGSVTNESLSADDRKSQIGRWSEWTKALQSSGNFRPGGVPLGVSGAVLRTRHKVADAGFPVDTQLVPGTYHIEAASLDAATELAKGCPILDLDGSVEIRPILERPQ